MLVWPDALTGFEPCARCAGLGFVCEHHPSEPCGDDQCDGAGLPCGICQSKTGKPRVAWMPLYVSTDEEQATTGAGGSLLQCLECEEFVPADTVRWFAEGGYAQRPYDGNWHQHPRRKSTKDDPTALPYCARCAAGV